MTMQERIAPLKELGSSVVADALRDLGRPDQTAAHGMRPVNRLHACAGVVRTAHFESSRGDDVGFMPLAGFIDPARAGDVLVLDAPRRRHPDPCGARSARRPRPRAAPPAW